MKWFMPLALVSAGMLFAGCVSHQAKSRAAAAPAAPVAGAPQPIVTPDNSPAAKVVAYDSVGRFVVLNVSVGQMPATNETMFLYRAGLKVGQVKITGPQSDNNIVADLVSGAAQVGDEAREQ
jgi:hypothetical protein